MAFVSFLISDGDVNKVATGFAPVLSNGLITNLAHDTIIDGYIVKGPGSVKIAIPYVGVPDSLTLLQKSKPKAYCF
jgi:hypothetical protein